MGKTGVSWSDFILLVLLVVLAVGGAWLGIRIARWSRTDDGREWVDALSRLRGEEYARANGWPINAAELSRRLLSASAPGDAVVTARGVQAGSVPGPQHAAGAWLPEADRIASLRLDGGRGDGRPRRRRARLLVGDPSG